VNPLYEGPRVEALRAAASNGAARHPLEPGGLVDELDAELGALVTAATRIAAKATAPAKPRWQIRSGADVAQPLKRIPWLCKSLAIGPGRPTILSGYGGVGKTFAAQQLVLAVASGERSIWGCYPLDIDGPQVAMQLDHEQGQYITDWRFQRLAFSMGIDIAALGDRLRVAHYPDLYLTSPDAEDVLAELTAGVKVCVLDSLRAFCPGIDENDSRIGQYLYLLARVSERTGCVFVVIHHEGKTSGENPRQGIERLRGSSSIAAGAGSVVSFVRAGASTNDIRIEHVRSNLGAPSRPELVRLVDEGQVLEITGKTEGLKIEWIPPEQMQQEASAAVDAEREVEMKKLVERVRACVERNPGIAGSSTAARLLKTNERRVADAWAILRASGAIENRGGGGKYGQWYAVQPQGNVSVEGDNENE